MSKKNQIEAPRDKDWTIVDIGPENEDWNRMTDEKILCVLMDIREILSTIQFKMEIYD